MDALRQKARILISEFKGQDYVCGLGCLGNTGGLVQPLGKKVLLITNTHDRDPENFQTLRDSLESAGLDIKGPLSSARPNAPKEDVLKIKEILLRENPEVVVVASGGSGIDAAKAAVVLTVLGGDTEDYFGVGKVSQKLEKTGKKLIPLVAVQTASSSAAHLTKYSNITDFDTHQKKLIVDEAVIPSRALFDYSVTQSMSASFTSDGAFDGLAHCLEVYYGAAPSSFERIQEIALTGIELIIASLKKANEDPSNMEAREALGLGTDLGGCAIMMGGTNGAHLTSFSLVDILSHGRACALLNPYYTVFFAPSIPKQLEKLSLLFARYGLTDKASSTPKSQDLGLTVAQALVQLSKSIGFPTTLEEIEGMSHAHIEKSLQAAKNPQLEMKLKNMPIPLTSKSVDAYMRRVLEAAMNGDFSLIKTISK